MAGVSAEGQGFVRNPIDFIPASDNWPEIGYLIIHRHNVQRLFAFEAALFLIIGGGLDRTFCYRKPQILI